MSMQKIYAIVNDTFCIQTTAIHNQIRSINQLVNSHIVLQNINSFHLIKLKYNHIQVHTQATKKLDFQLFK